MSPEDQKAFDIVRKLFKNDYGEPFEMTAGQIQLFRAIYEKQYARTQFECYTQYGKSDVVSMAVLLRATTFPEKWIILGGTKEKAGIIMGKCIKHLFENNYTLAKFQVDKDENLDAVRRHRSKERLSFRVDEDDNFGEIMVLSADARRKSEDAGDVLIGHGGQNLIEDDAALIPDKIHGKALRMLGGHKVNFLLKITNSFGHNHAWRSRNDPKYHNIVIDYTQGIKEGRITPEYIEEMRGQLDKVMFGILYECKYPPSGMIMEGDWMQLLLEEDLQAALGRKLQSIGLKRLGVDVAEGINYSAFVIRTDNVARLKEKNQEPDLMKTADKIGEIIGDERILGSNVFIDSVGVGSGVYSRAVQMGIDAQSVKSGDKPTEKTDEEKKLDPIEFFNMRSQMYWHLKLWIQQGGALEGDYAIWSQLLKILFKESGDKKIKIMSKEEMRVRGYISQSESTDIPDALAMTFFPRVKKIKYTYPTDSGSVQQSGKSPLDPYYPEM